jgi:hypothetical protein
MAGTWVWWVKRLAGIGWRERALVAEAVLQLLAARARIALLPFRRIGERLGTFVPPADPRVAERRSPGAPEQARTAAQVSWAVVGAARHVPFRAVCLPQAMAAHAMLRRRGIACAVHFGAQRGKEKPIDAHAWVDAAGVKVTGYPLEPSMTEIGCFV